MKYHDASLHMQWAAIGVLANTLLWMNLLVLERLVNPCKKEDMPTLQRMHNKLNFCLGPVRLNLNLEFWAFSCGSNTLSIHQETINCLICSFLACAVPCEGGVPEVWLKQRRLAAGEGIQSCSSAHALGNKWRRDTAADSYIVLWWKWRDWIWEIPGFGPEWTCAWTELTRGAQW